MTVAVDGARYLAIPARHAGSSQTGDGCGSQKLARRFSRARTEGEE
jgi:hypothetical protein